MPIKRPLLYSVVVVASLVLYTSSSFAALAGPPPPETIAYHLLTGKARFIGGQNASPLTNPAAVERGTSPEQAARTFLDARGGEFGLENQAQNLQVLRQTRADNGARTVRFQQTYRGVPIVGGELIIQMNSANAVLSASGEILPNLATDVTPRIDPNQAIQIAFEAVAHENSLPLEALKANNPELWLYNPALLTPFDGATVLTWRIQVSSITASADVREMVLVDAKRGGIVIALSLNADAKNRLTYNGNATAVLPGTLVCNESNPTCTGGTTDAINAHRYAGETYDFYLTNHNRDGMDGAGMSIISTTNSTATTNGRWNGSQMLYAPGWSNADDVVAHELTHGVTDYEAKLFNFWQSGAINESLADVWGEFVDLSNSSGTDTAAVRWKIAEDAPGGAVRDMKDPTVYSDPDKMTSSFYYLGFSQTTNGHKNTGVNNKAVYLMVDGGTFNGQTVLALGITKVAKIYYYVQTNLLTSGADYADLYYALNASCAAQLGTAGITAADCQQVQHAVDAVEMNLQPTGGYNADTAACGVAGETVVNTWLDNFESGMSNWVSGSTVGTNHWTYDWNYTATLGTFAHSGEHFVFADDAPAAATDSTLRMVSAVTVPTNGKLLFHHSYAMETNKDGGMLEYSVNNGAAWNDAGTLMDGNGYKTTLASATNPLNGRQAFGGISNGYISTRLNLSTLAGQSLLLRFRMGLDAANHAIGWWVDDVQIYQCAAPPTFAPLLRFTAQVGKKKVVRLYWETGSELNVLGFNLYRASRLHGTSKLLNQTLIAAQQTGALAGAEYTYKDAHTKKGAKQAHPKAYFYQLEIVNADGTRVRSDVVRIKLAESAQE